MNVALWIIQGLLALLFLFAGGSKLVLPLEALAGPVALPGLFVRFIGVAEVLGGLGLILPGLLRIRPVLTRLAAAGLALIMAGATVMALVTGGGAQALIPLLILALLAFVIYGRGKTAMYGSASLTARANEGLSSNRPRYADTAL